MAIVDGLITLADAKNSLGITVTTYDADIERYVEAATPVIERFTGSVIQRTKTFTFDGGGRTLLIPERMLSVTSVTQNGSVITDFTTDLKHGVIYGGTTTAGRAFILGQQNVSVTCLVGQATIPPNVILAARELVRFWWQVGRQANRPGVGEMNQSLEDPPTGLLKRVQQLCQPTFDVPGFA